MVRGCRQRKSKKAKSLSHEANEHRWFIILGLNLEFGTTYVGRRVEATQVEGQAPVLLILSRVRRLLSEDHCTFVEIFQLKYFRALPPTSKIVRRRRKIKTLALASSQFEFLSAHDFREEESF